MEFIAIAVIVVAFIITIIQRVNRCRGKNNNKPNGTVVFTDAESSNIEETKKYIPKDSIMTDCERNFYAVLETSIDLNRFVLLPQVNLAVIMKKVSEERYQNELYRNIDFCILDKCSFKPLLLIELNDSTHTQAPRYARDQNVKGICELAGIPLIAFNTNLPNEQEYVQNRVMKFLS